MSHSLQWFTQKSIIGCYRQKLYSVGKGPNEWSFKWMWTTPGNLMFVLGRTVAQAILRPFRSLTTIEAPSMFLSPNNVMLPSKIAWSATGPAISCVRTADSPSQSWEEYSVAVRILYRIWVNRSEPMLKVVFSFRGYCCQYHGLQSFKIVPWDPCENEWNIIVVGWGKTTSNNRFLEETIEKMKLGE